MRADASRPVTFLFTDIEGSTALWERAPDAMTTALARHDRLLRDAVASHGGRIVKSTGDGVMAVFDAPRDAVDACVAFQRDLHAPAPGLALNVRMGLHSGAAEARDGDWFGSAPNKAARIMAAAYGGQVLVSSTAAEALRVDGVALRDLGEHRLKGLLAPERLSQVVADGLRDAFPPLASQAGHSLPDERDDFVGRGDVLATLRERYAGGARLVTVLAIGGAGKTRVATRYAWDALAGYPGGAWFCDLTQARTPDGIVRAVAQGLDVALGKDDPVAQLGHAIAGRGRCLVVVDNVEQVVGPARAALGAWLDRAPAAHFLVTSRESLGLPGEQIVDVPPLARDDAAELFVRRAREAHPPRTLGDDDREDLRRLVEMLEGLPLAIELAATRSGVMSPRTMLGRMSERFKLLASTRGRTDRQAALRATFDWSWDLLAPAERATLAQLSVFQGGATLDAIEAVVDLSGCAEAPWPADIVQSLLQKSLVRSVADGRFDLLGSVREYAAGQLVADGAFPGSGGTARHGAERRHGAHYAALDERAIVEANGVELDNLVAACRRAVERGDGPTAVGSLRGAWAALGWRGPYRVATELAAQVRRVVEDPASRATADLVAGNALLAAGGYEEARATLERALSLAREAAERGLEGEALISLGRLHGHHAQRAEGVRALDAALALAVERDDRDQQSRILQHLGQLSHFSGATDEGRKQLIAALALARALGNRRHEGRILCDLGVLCADAGPLADAHAYYAGSLAAARATGERSNESVVLSNLGVLHQMEGRHDEAAQALESALSISREAGYVRLEPIILCNLGIVCDKRGDPATARRHYEAGLPIARALGHRRIEGQILGYLGALHARLGDAHAARDCLDRATSALEEIADASSLGIVHCLRAEAGQRAGDHAAARAALAAAEAAATAVGAQADSELGIELARVRSLLA